MIVNRRMCAGAHAGTHSGVVGLRCVDKRSRSTEKYIVSHATAGTWFGFALAIRFKLIWAYPP